MCQVREYYSEWSGLLHNSHRALDIGGITTGSKNPKVKKGYGIKANLKLLNTEYNQTDPPPQNNKNNKNPTQK